MSIDFSLWDFGPVIEFPDDPRCIDFSHSTDPVLPGKYRIGRYLDYRPDVYTQKLFANSRCIHMGIDFGSSAGTEVWAFYEGQILYALYRDTPGDYGGTIITEHKLIDQDGKEYALYALYGHLSKSSTEEWRPGSIFSKGQRLGVLGQKHENGGWVPHLHFQISLEKPKVPDMLGAVSREQLEWAKRTYLDPRLALGLIYVDPGETL